MQFVPDVLEAGDLGFGLFEVQPPRVVRVEFLDGDGLDVAFGEVFVVVEGAVVGGDAVEVAHVFSLGAFFLGEESLVHLFAVADSNDFDVFLAAAEEFADGFSLGLDGAGGGFLDEDVAVLAVLEGEEDQVDSFLEAHDEAGHGRFRQCDRLSGADLVDPQGDDAAAGAHDVAVAGAADAGLEGVAALGDGDFFLKGFADAHGVDGVGRLVGGEADDAVHAGVDRGVEDVVCADHVGLDGFHREELAGRDLLEGGRMEDVVHAAHGHLEGGFVADVADVEFDLVGDTGVHRLVFVTHVVLFFLVAGENADFLDVGGQEAPQHGISEAPGPAGDHQGFVFEDGHMVLGLIFKLLL